MLDIKEIRKSSDFFIKKLKDRNIKDSEKIIKNLLTIDFDYRKKLEENQSLLAERNKISKELGINKQDKNKFDELSKKVTEIKNKCSIIENDVLKLKKDIDFILYSLPNIADEQVPVGVD